MKLRNYGDSLLNAFNYLFGNYGDSLLNAFNYLFGQRLVVAKPVNLLDGGLLDTRVQPEYAEEGTEAILITPSLTLSAEGEGEKDLRPLRRASASSG